MTKENAIKANILLEKIEAANSFMNYIHNEFECSQTDFNGVPVKSNKDKINLNSIFDKTLITEIIIAVKKACNDYLELKEQQISDL